MASSWIFSCNPKSSDVPHRIQAGQVKVGDNDFWFARQHSEQMSPGDRVFLWVTGPSAGLYAVASIISEVYTREGTGALEGGPAVDLRYEKLLPSPLNREQLQEDGKTNDLTILRVARQTNYALTARQAVRLAERCGVEALWPFDPKAMAEVLRIPFDDPSILNKAGWQARVGSVINPFFDEVKQEVERRQPGLERWSHKRARSDIIKRRQNLASLDGRPRKLEALTKEVNITVKFGLDAAEPARRPFLFAGVCWWGPHSGLEATLAELKREGLLSGSSSYFSFESGGFTGHYLCIGDLTLTPEELASCGPSELLERIVAECVLWIDRVLVIQRRGGLRVAASLYLKSKQDSDFWGNRRARCDERLDRIPAIRDKLQSLTSGAISIAEFASWMQHESFDHNLWGFKGMSGGMFLNLLAQADQAAPENFQLRNRLSELMTPPRLRQRPGKSSNRESSSLRRFDRSSSRRRASQPAVYLTS